MAKAYIIGNGPSLTPALLESLDGETWAVNRIWKIYHRTTWRPNNYVRAELPSYDEKTVLEDLRAVCKYECVIWAHDGFRAYARSVWNKSNPWTRWEFFETCDGTKRHNWHLPLICGYGTVVHIAAQLAIKNGADEICFVGCDLGTEHFYPGEDFTNEKLAKVAHKIAERNAQVTYG